DRRHGPASTGPGDPRRARPQGVRGPAQRDRPHCLRGRAAAHQHAARQADAAGRLRSPPGRTAASSALHHDAVGGVSGLRRRDRAPEPGRRGPLATGVARAGPRDVGRMDRLSARDPAFAAALRLRARGEVREGEALARYSTYRIGGAGTLLLARSPEDVGAAVRFAVAEGVPWFALGLGSNILLPDAGLDALVVRLGKGMDHLVRDGTRWRPRARGADDP